MEVQFPGLGLEFTIDRVAFKIGSIEIMWYAVLITTGFILALVYAMVCNKRYSLNRDKFIDVIILGLVLGIVGARAYYVVFHLYSFDSFWEILNIRSGGLAIYGGVIGAVLAALIGAKWKKLNLFSMLDVACIGFLIGQGLGRWGNFMNQEAFGSYTDLPWGMLSENTLKIVPEGPVHPCFLYESIWCFVGFIALHFISKYCYKFRGQMFLLYVFWYGLGRFWIEGLRTDSLYLIPDVIRVSQLLAGLCVLAAPVFLVLGFKGKMFDRVTPDGKTIPFAKWKAALAEDGAAAIGVIGAEEEDEAAEEKSMSESFAQFCAKVKELWSKVTAKFKK